jgi:hypothetical protein
MALESFLCLALLQIICLGNLLYKLYLQNVEVVIVSVHETKNKGPKKKQEVEGDTFQ